MTEADIKARNPDLNETTFQLLRGKWGNTTGIDARPFPIIQATNVGVRSMMPWLPENRNYSLLEWTPLSAGEAHTRQFTFTDVNGTETKVFVLEYV